MANDWEKIWYEAAWGDARRAYWRGTLIDLVGVGLALGGPRLGLSESVSTAIGQAVLNQRAKRRSYFDTPAPEPTPAPPPNREPTAYPYLWLIK